MDRLTLTHARAAAQQRQKNSHLPTIATKK